MSAAAGGAATVPATVAAAAERFGEQPAVSSDGAQLSYAELGEASRDFGAALVASLAVGGSGHVGADDTWLKVYLYSRAQSVMGGTSQIQRNLIARRILGLPT